jgi:hypothetical protein
MSTPVQSLSYDSDFSEGPLTRSTPLTSTILLVQHDIDDGVADAD